VAPLGEDFFDTAIFNSPYKSLSSKNSVGKATATHATTCNQLNAGLRQLGHFIFHSGKTVPQFWQDQIILGIDCYLWPLRPWRPRRSGFAAALPLSDAICH